MSRPALMVAVISSLVMAPAPGAAKDNGMVIGCVSSADPITRTPTGEMLNWISTYNAAWNPEDAFSIGGAGAKGRLFATNDRLIHPAELAQVISNSPNFSGKKKKLILLGISDSEAGGAVSYASQLSKLLGVKVSGCEADAYFMRNGSMMCGSNPVFVVGNSNDVGRLMPAGYSMGHAGFLMLFCANSTESAISPQSVLTTSVVYGLFADEQELLIKQAESDPAAAFRLYQYYWLSRRDPETALRWLEKAANLGLNVAKFNLAYELFETGGVDAKVKAETLAGELVAKGFAGPDLRRFYAGN